MAVKSNKIKVLLAQFPLESHSRGLITVAGLLRDAGMEVVIAGNALPREIIRVARQEKADVVGISSYCGGELVLCRELMKAAEKEGIKQGTVFILGGVFPPGDAAGLNKLGISATFPPSSTREEIVAGIESALGRRDTKS